jgi:hypothetical protein
MFKISWDIMSVENRYRSQRYRSQRNAVIGLAQDQGWCVLQRRNLRSKASRATSSPDVKLVWRQSNDPLVCWQINGSNAKLCETVLLDWRI